MGVLLADSEFELGDLVTTKTIFESTKEAHRRGLVVVASGGKPGSQLAMNAMQILSEIHEVSLTGEVRYLKLESPEGVHLFAHPKELIKWETAMADLDIISMKAEDARDALVSSLTLSMLKENGY